MRLEFGEFVFDSEARELLRSGEPLRLTPKAFDLLAVLIAQRPRALRKRELMDRVWPDAVVEEGNLKNLVGEIRGVLGAEAIRTIPRYGYAFRMEERKAPVGRLLQGDRIHRLTSGENRIGRATDCAVVIDFTGVSRHHAKIAVTGERFILEDLGSKNGTWIDGVRVSGPVELRDGNRIRIAAITLTFRSAADAISTDTVSVDPAPVRGSS